MAWDDQPKAKTGQRGKEAEKFLQKEFDKLNLARSDFCYERIYDARSSQGKVANPRSGDFVLYYQGRNILVECKEVDHEYRLPRANFPVDQRARMRKRQLAGTEPWVCVYFKPLKAWRMLPITYFDVEDTGSWDFRNLEPLSLASVIGYLLKEH